ncbi:MAG TPA: sulfurtransferase TusA family protein [Candidatus Sulfotelmatobacter sp.]|nr:sulfurtransferase TusA family protein [Candidatus Sulfotelmatobacter sp.]
MAQPVVMDARGLRCPLPVARARDRLAEMPEGSRLDVLADDPLALLDMQAFCAREGHVFLGHEVEEGGAVRMHLRRGISR